MTLASLKILAHNNANSTIRIQYGVSNRSPRLDKFDGWKYRIVSNWLLTLHPLPLQLLKMFQQPVQHEEHELHNQRRKELWNNVIIYLGFEIQVCLNQEIRITRMYLIRNSVENCLQTRGFRFPCQQFHYLHTFASLTYVSSSASIQSSTNRSPHKSPTTGQRLSIWTVHWLHTVIWNSE